MEWLAFGQLVHVSSLPVKIVPKEDETSKSLCHEATQTESWTGAECLSGAERYWLQAISITEL